MGLVNSPVSLALMVPLVGGAMLYRRRPGLGMLVLILGGLLHVWLGVMPMPADLAFAIGGFGAAAYGRPITRALAAFLLPIGAWIGLFLLTTTFHEELLQIVATVRADPALWAQALGKIAPALVVSAIVSLAPWLLGLAFRAVRQSRSADLRRAAAEEDRRAAVAGFAQARGSWPAWRPTRLAPGRPRRGRPFADRDPCASGVGADACPTMTWRRSRRRWSMSRTRLAPH